MYYELILLGLVCLMAPWLAKLAGYQIERKAFDLVGVAGIFFMLGAAFGLGMALVDLLHDIGKAMLVVTFVMGWISLFVGAIWGTIDVIREPTHRLLGHRT